MPRRRRSGVDWERFYNNIASDEMRLLRQTSLPTYFRLCRPTVRRWTTPGDTPVRYNCFA